MARKIARVFAYSVFHEQAAEGGYVASVPALPGCHTQGETLEETERNVKEAIALYLESLAEHWSAVLSSAIRRSFPIANSSRLEGQTPKFEKRPRGPARYVIITPDSDNMIRTQVSLDEHEYDVAKTQAKALGISVAEFVRRAIREALPSRGEGSWMKFAGLVETGNPRSSQSIDEIVYGQKD